MCQIKDMRGVPIEQGDIVVYGKSDRNRPIKLGTVVSVEDDCIIILGKGNVKQGKIPKFHSNRILVLPEDYLEDVKHHTPKCRNCSGGCQ